MKTIIIMLVSLSVSMGVSAQRKGGHYYASRPRVVIVPSISYGIGYGYPYFGYPYSGYPYGYMYPNYGSSRMPYKLSLEIQSIKSDYRNQIRETRKDKSLSQSVKRQQIHSLKAERDKDIFEAARNFNSRSLRNNQNNKRTLDSQGNGNDNSFQENEGS